MCSIFQKKYWKRRYSRETLHEQFLARMCAIFGTFQILVTPSSRFGHSIFVFSSHPKRELASPLTEPIPSTEVLPWLSQTSNGQIFVPMYENIWGLDNTF